jgi:DNA replication and repair protein RecF
MNLESVTLQNFRSYQQATFSFSKETTFIVGQNTAGKSNLIEAIYFLSSGKSFRADKELHIIQFGADVARAKGKLSGGDESFLEAVFAFLPTGNSERYFQKRYLVNDVPRRRVDFAGILPSVLFTPEDLEIIIASPSIRRSFLDSVLEQVDREYRIAVTSYTKALRHRNALLELARETARRNTEQFAYWDELLIGNGMLITEKREAFIEFLNTEGKEMIDFRVVYDPSRISAERLAQYADGEIGAGVTLVGPHRDDFFVEIPVGVQNKDVRYFGSRGQQRLVVLQLKLLQIHFMEKNIGQRPLLLLDDIFSELDNRHISHVLELIGKQQTIITTTHEEFLGKKAAKLSSVIVLPGE